MDITDFPTAAPDDYVNRLYHFESDNGRAPDAPGSQYQGLAQLGREERQRYNVTDPNDPVQVRRAVDGIYSRNAQQFYDRFGRLPTDPEQYLMHNQGVGGYSKMLRNPGDFTVINPAGNTPWAHGHTAGMTNADWVNGWTNHWNGAPSAPQAPQPQPRQAMADTDPYAALLQQYSRPSQATLSDGLIPYLTDNSSGLNRLERVGLWMQSLQNPNALAQLGAANHQAEQRNQMMLHLLQAKQSDDYRRAMLGLSTQRQADTEGGKDVFGLPTNRANDQQQGAPMWAPPGSVPTAPSAAPTAPTAPTERPMWMPPAGSTSSLDGLPQLAMGATDLPTPGLMAFDDTSRAAARPAAPAPRPANPTDVRANLDAAAIRKWIASTGVDMDTPSPERDRVLQQALGGLSEDFGIRGLAKSWGEGGLDPHVREGTQSGVYDPMTRLARIYASAIYGDKNIQQAWDRTQAQKQFLEKDLNVNSPSSLEQKMLFVRNMAGQGLDLNRRYADLNNYEGIAPNVSANPQASGGYQATPQWSQEPGSSANVPSWLMQGMHFPRSVPWLGGLGIPGVNVHQGEDSGRADAFNGYAAAFGREVAKFQIPGQGTGEERQFNADAIHDQSKPSTYYEQMSRADEEARRYIESARQSVADQFGKNSPQYQSWYNNTYMRTKDALDTQRSDLENRFGGYSKQGTEDYQREQRTVRTTPLAILDRIRRGGM